MIDSQLCLPRIFKQFQERISDIYAGRHYKDLHKTVLETVKLANIRVGAKGSRMVQQGRQHAWGVGFVVVILLLSPLACSAWGDEREFIEQQGNSSFLCKSSAHCTPCSHADKEANKFQCQPTGYHQPFKCLERKSVQQEEQNKNDVEHPKRDLNASQGKSTIQIEETEVGAVGSHGRRLKSTGLGGRKLVESTPVLKIEGGLKMYNSFRSCTPADLRMDKVTVLQFEIIAFASFATCFPLIYYRRKHSFSGLTRIPANPRF